MSDEENQMLTEIQRDLVKLNQNILLTHDSNNAQRRQFGVPLIVLLALILWRVW